MEKTLKEIHDNARHELEILMAALYNKGYMDGVKAHAMHEALSKEEQEDE